MTTATTQKAFKLFEVNCNTVTGVVGKWTVVAFTPEAALIQVTRRLLSYFGAGLIVKLPTHKEISATECLDPQPPEVLDTFGLRTEDLTVPAQQFITIF
jgi:hypothetical protein